MTKKSKLRYVRLYTDVVRDRYWKVSFSDGTKKIPVDILMTENSIGKNQRGIPFECVLAHGIEKFAKDHPGHFPHPVLHVYVTRSAVYIIDRFKDGQPSHAVRYMHAFARWTRTFDKMTKAQFLAKYDGVGFRLNLNPGRVYRVGEATTGGNGNGRRSINDGSRSFLKVCRGALKRAQDAGLVPRTADVLEDA
jgi:hypothetical protein